MKCLEERGCFNEGCPVLAGFRHEAKEPFILGKGLDGWVVFHISYKCTGVEGPACLDIEHRKLGILESW